MREFVTYPGQGDYTFHSPPFPSNTFTTVKNPTDGPTWNAAYPPRYVNEVGIIEDWNSTVGYFVKPYTSDWNFVATQLFQYRCPCNNNNAWTTIAGPLTIHRALTPNSDGTWRFAGCKDDIPPSKNQPPLSCANKDPLPQ